MTAIGTALGARLFPRFRSAEQKQGEYRADAAPQSGPSTRLPTVGGPALLIGVTAAVVACTWLVPEARGIAAPFLMLCWLQGVLGWLDDLAKSRGQGLGERAKLVWLVTVVIAWSAWFSWVWLPPSTSPWQRIAWLAVASAYLLWVTLSVSFSDGVDGLTAGVCAITAAPFVVVAVVFSWVSLGLLAASIDGGAVGMLLLNLPSRWTRRGSIPRRARAYVGDSGALVLGSGLGALTLLFRWEWIWLLVGAALVLEGSSVLLQTGVLVPLFRRWLSLVRYRSPMTLVPHTDFPLPFLATPYHHHLSLAGLGPLSVVWRLYLIAGVGSVLGIAIALVESVTLRVAIGLLACALYSLVLVWSAASRTLFLAWSDDQSDPMLMAYRGLPFALGRARLFVATGDAVANVAPAALATWSSRIGRPLNRHDAAAMLGLAAWLSGDQTAAVRRWRPLPPLALLLRQEVAVRLAWRAQQGGELDDLMESWRRALSQVYQAGRIELVAAELCRVADREGLPGLEAGLQRWLFASARLRDEPA